jgi:hypothetical protein
MPANACICRALTYLDDRLMANPNATCIDPVPGLCDIDAIQNGAIGTTLEISWAGERFVGWSGILLLMA